MPLQSENALNNWFLAFSIQNKAMSPPPPAVTYPRVGVIPSSSSGVFQPPSGAKATPLMGTDEVRVKSELKDPPARDVMTTGGATRTRKPPPPPAWHPPPPLVPLPTTDGLDVVVSVQLEEELQIPTVTVPPKQHLPAFMMQYVQHYVAYLNKEFSSEFLTEGYNR